jgi:NAD(P)H-hydrate epimerase
MRALDRHAIEQLGIPGRLLMENAGRSVATALLARYPRARRPLIVCGAGNNGGDGFVVARVLREWDRRLCPVVATLGDAARRSEEAAANFELLASCDVPRLEIKDTADLGAPIAAADLILDCLFGVGLARAVEGLYAEVLTALARAPAPLVALDVPSSCSSDTGELLGPELDPDCILTLALPKLGLAQAALGPVEVCDIGLPAEALVAVPVRQHVWTRQAARARLPERPARAHKGSFGHVLVVAGSTGKTGAAALAATGALRAGAGLVTAAVPASLNPILEVKLTEAMTLPMLEGLTGALGEAAAESLARAAAERDALAVGPGLGTDPGSVRAVERLLHGLERPAVVDADGLNAFAGRPERLASAGPRVLTPHPGEMARLLGRSVRELQRDRVAAARELARRASAVVVLKGARSVIAEPGGAVRINATGGPGLASGGTGDVLAGVIAALLAQRVAPFDAAALGVYLHGLAGELGPDAGDAAGDVAARLPEAWRRLAGAEDESVEPGLVHRFP